MREKKCIIVDIDGTLALRTMRGPYDTSRYNEDVICNPVRTILDMVYFRNNEHYDSDITILLVSWRSEEFREVTVKRLEDKGVPYHKLYMRPTWDTRHDTEIKKEIYENHIKDEYIVMFAFDDRVRIVDQRRELGIYTFDVNQTRSVF